MKFYSKKFTDLSLDELYQILSLRCAVFVLEQGCAFLECDGKDVDCYHVFTKDGDKVIAYLRIPLRSVVYDEVSIGRVLVKEEYRKKGISRKLVSKAMDFITDELNEARIKIQAQAYLEKFYAEFGFKTVSEEYLEDGIPHIDMVYDERK